MGLRFRRNFRLAPGVKLNVGRRSLSASIGRRGFWYTTGSVGRRVTIGLPGTGLSWTSHLPAGQRPRLGRPVVLLAVVVALAAIAYVLSALG
jgi:hypothetical protein